MSLLRFEDEDLRDYAQHVSYDRWPTRIYNFPCEQHGAVAAMRLQIMLHYNELILTRARHDSGLFFYTGDTNRCQC